MRPAPLNLHACGVCLMVSRHVGGVLESAAPTETEDGGLQQPACKQEGQVGMAEDWLTTPISTSPLYHTGV